MPFSFQNLYADVKHIKSTIKRARAQNNNHDLLNYMINRVLLYFYFHRYIIFTRLTKITSYSLISNIITV